MAHAQLLREDYFLLTLTLSPIGGEGKKWDDLMGYGGTGFQPVFL
jgi:hypothetical protein